MLPRCVLRAVELCTPLTPGCAQRGYQVQISEFLSALFHYLWCSRRMFSFKSHMRIAIDLMTAVDLDPCKQVIALILPRLDWTRIKMSSVLIREGVDLGSWYGSGARFTNRFSFHSHLDSNTVIATKFCTWHDSCAVVACATICCDLMASNGVMARRSFHRIRIAGKKR